MKILIVRFSSIGDIVLTTPIVRCLKLQLADTEIHYLTKEKFVEVISSNPYIDKLISFKEKLSEIIPVLKKENYDFVIDLHHNIRTLKLKWTLKKKAFSFNKLNYGKFLMVYLKINQLPKAHIVNRYFETTKTFGVVNDNKGLDYFIEAKNTIDIEQVLPANFKNGYNVLVVGGSYYTKRIPITKLLEICTVSSKPIALLGGNEDMDTAYLVTQKFNSKAFSLCGKLNLNQSASVIKQAEKVITSDTGLMHIAAAYKKQIISLWGNTIPEFGMGPYLAGEGSEIWEVEDLVCRPCSKLGFHKCPKGHFKCMNNIKVRAV